MIITYLKTRLKQLFCRHEYFVFFDEYYAKEYVDPDVIISFKLMAVKADYSWKECPSCRKTKKI